MRHACSVFGLAKATTLSVQVAVMQREMQVAILTAYLAVLLRSLQNSEIQREDHATLLSVRKHAEQHNLTEILDLVKDCD